MLSYSMLQYICFTAVLSCFKMSLHWWKILLKLVSKHSMLYKYAYILGTRVDTGYFHMCAVCMTDYIHYSTLLHGYKYYMYCIKYLAMLSYRWHNIWYWLFFAKRTEYVQAVLNELHDNLWDLPVNTENTKVIFVFNGRTIWTCFSLLCSRLSIVLITGELHC
jgi:hypothetical protein